MSQQTLVAYFDHPAEAERAADALASAGLRRDSIRVNTQTAETTAHHDEHKGFWDSITDFFMPNDDRQTYDEGVRRGGAAVVVQTDDAHVDHVAEILENHGAVDVDEREAAWHQDRAASGPAQGAPAGKGAEQSAEAIPVAEEELHVGKRQVTKGRVRIRSYAVETPVEEDVALRKESVNVERRPAEHSARDGDDGLFRERTVSAEEVDEEAVVAKEARVKEEVVVRKDAHDETQEIRDTVRHTEVEVEDDHKTHSK